MAFRSLTLSYERTLAAQLFYYLWPTTFHDQLRSCSHPWDLTQRCLPIQGTQIAESDGLNTSFPLNHLYTYRYTMEKGWRQLC
jgi:hypothetical protein